MASPRCTQEQGDRVALGVANGAPVRTGLLSGQCEYRLMQNPGFTLISKDLLRATVALMGWTIPATYREDGRAEGL
jgi:hypothetical protein